MLKLAVLALLVSCGSKNEDSAASKPAVDTPAPPATKPPAVRPPTPLPPPPADKQLGECSFTVSGAATATVTAPGGMSSVALSYWTIDPKVRDALYKDKQGMIINCSAADTSLSFTANKLTTDELPFGPKKYTLQRGLKNQIHVLGRTPDGAILGAEGTFEITAMDAQHVAGTFAFKSELLKKNAGGRAPLEVTGHFDYKCPGKCT